jgi:cytochrome c556
VLLLQHQAKESCVKKSTFLVAGIVSVVMTAFIGSSFAALPDDREAVMKDVMKSFKVLIGISKSGQFDAAVVNKEASAIAANLDKFKDLFPDGSQAGDTKASPDIWKDPAGFEAARNKARDAAVNLSKITDPAAFKAAFDEQSGACKGCHDKYRAN